jgi:hypothetical protein
MSKFILLYTRFEIKNKCNIIHTANCNLLVYQNMERQYPRNIVSYTECPVLHLSAHKIKQQTPQLSVWYIYQLNFGISRLKCIRIMSCLCPLNTAGCSQACNYWWAVSHLRLIRPTTINSSSLYISQLVFWGPPSLLHKIYGGGSFFFEGKRGCGVKLTSHFHLEPILGMSGTVTLLHLYTFFTWTERI